MSDIVKEFNSVGILIIDLSVTTKIAKQLNHMKIEMSKNFELQKHHIVSFTHYNKNYKKPDIKEFNGIDESRYMILYDYPFLLINVKEWWFVYDK